MRPRATARSVPRTRDHVPEAVGEPEAPPARAPAEAIIALQRSAGNCAVARLLDSVGAQSRWPRGYGPWPDGDPYLTPPEPPEQIEYKALAPIRDYFEKKSYEGYLEIRDLFLAKFGLKQDGPQAAVQRALVYYKEQIKPHSFMGGPPINVHLDMIGALQSAEEALGGKKIPIRSIGGAVIRLTRGSSTVMSDHSWGASIDVNATTSPMVGGLSPGSRRVDMIEAITGTDITKDFEGAPLTSKPKSPDEMFQEALRLEEASDELKTAFQDEDSLREAAFRIAAERGNPTGSAEDLLQLMYDAGYEDRKDIAEWERRRRVATRKQRESMPAEKRLWNWEPYPEGDAAEAAPARQALAAFVFPSEEDQSRLWDEELVESTVDVLAGMGRIFEDTFDPKDPDKRVEPNSTFPSDGQLALHGFMSVPPELVAVLSGDTMGNLKWLGSSAGDVKDYMHFDLRERPAFY